MQWVGSDYSVVIGGGNQSFSAEPLALFFVKTLGYSFLRRRNCAIVSLMLNRPDKLYYCIKKFRPQGLNQA